MVLSGKAQRAFRLDLEPVPLRDAYGRDSLGEKALLARRLVEAGVTFVVVSGAWGYFDHHGDNVPPWGGILKGLTPILPTIDRALTTLIEDLDARGLLDETLVVWAGEFGRSPRVNSQAGRDHWPQGYTVLLAGGGVQGGAVYGASDRIGAFPAADPVTPADLAATIFWRFGIDPETEVKDQTGRPFKLANGEPIGASGLRQVHEVVLQLRGDAGDRQIPGRRRVGFTQVYGAPGVSACAVLTV